MEAPKPADAHRLPYTRQSPLVCDGSVAPCNEAMSMRCQYLTPDGAPPCGQGLPHDLCGQAPLRLLAGGQTFL